MMDLKTLVSYLDEYLGVREIVDYSQALNGLQIEAEGPVVKVAAAVDACESVIRDAVACGANLLLVHHGLYWNGGVLTGAMYRKVRVAMEYGLAVYSSHLPLDMHPEVGNNMLLAKKLGLKNLEPFMVVKGQALGVRGETTLALHSLAKKLEKALGGAAHLCPGGIGAPSKVGIVTGGAGSEVARAKEEGVDTFITGEGPHWSYTMAEEIGLNVFYGGHYATETFGVCALAEHLEKQFGLPWEFVDHPTGL